MTDGEIESFSKLTSYEQMLELQIYFDKFKKKSSKSQLEEFLDYIHHNRKSYDD